MFCGTYENTRVWWHVLIPKIWQLRKIQRQTSENALLSQKDEKDNGHVHGSNAQRRLAKQYDLPTHETQISTLQKLKINLLPHNFTKNTVDYSTESALKVFD